VIGLISFVFYILFSFITNVIHANIVGGVSLLLLLIIHLRRRDYHFVQLIDEHSWRVFFTDYLLIALPVFILILIKGFCFILLGVIACIVCIAFFKRPFNRIRNGFPVPRFIPAKAFELRIGMRRYGVMLCLLYLGAFAGLLVPYLSFVFLWFCIVIVFDCFRYGESRAILCSSETKAGKFLLQKININLRAVVLALLPVCFLYFLMYPANWWLLLIFITLSLLNVILYVVSKYALYEPDSKITGGEIPISLSFIGIVIPILAPLTIFLLLRYSFRAQQNLTQYLYAYD